MNGLAGFANWLNAMVYSRTVQWYLIITAFQMLTQYLSLQHLYSEPRLRISIAASASLQWSAWSTGKYHGWAKWVSIIRLRCNHLCYGKLPPCALAYGILFLCYYFMLCCMARPCPPRFSVSRFVLTQQSHCYDPLLMYPYGSRVFSSECRSHSKTPFRFSRHQTLPISTASCQDPTGEPSYSRTLTI